MDFTIVFHFDFLFSLFFPRLPFTVVKPIEITYSNRSNPILFFSLSRLQLTL